MSCEDIKSAVIEVSQIKVRANEPDINIKRICDETELSAQQIHNDITQALKLLCITPNYTGYEYIREAEDRAGGRQAHKGYVEDNLPHSRTAPRRHPCKR